MRKDIGLCLSEYCRLEPVHSLVSQVGSPCKQDVGHEAANGERDRNAALERRNEHAAQDAGIHRLLDSAVALACDHGVVCSDSEKTDEVGAIRDNWDLGSGGTDNSKH